MRYFAAFVAFVVCELAVVGLVATLNSLTIPPPAFRCASCLARDLDGEDSPVSAGKASVLVHPGIRTDDGLPIQGH